MQFRLPKDYLKLDAGYNAMEFIGGKIMKMDKSTLSLVGDSEILAILHRSDI
jgi:hypothetical protein